MIASFMVYCTFSDHPGPVVVSQARPLLLHSTDHFSVFYWCTDTESDWCCGTWMGMIEQHMVQEKAIGRTSHTVGMVLIFDHGDTSSHQSLNSSCNYTQFQSPCWHPHAHFCRTDLLSHLCHQWSLWLCLASFHTDFFHSLVPTPVAASSSHISRILPIRFVVTPCPSSESSSTADFAAAVKYDCTLRHQDWEMHGKGGVISINLYREVAFF